MTPKAAARVAAAAEASRHPSAFDSYETRPLPERCIAWRHEGPPLLPPAYNDIHQIFQTSDYVVVFTELHVHMMLSIPPKYSVAQVIGYIKGKSAIHIAREFAGRSRSFVGQHFGARGYFVSTLGRDERVIRAYIRAQELEDRRHEQLRLDERSHPEGGPGGRVATTSGRFERLTTKSPRLCRGIFTDFAYCLLPPRIKHWSLTSLRQRLVKTGSPGGQACAVLLAPAGRRAFDPATVRRHAAEDLGATRAGRLTRGLSATKAAWRRKDTRVERCLRNALKAGAPVGRTSARAEVTASGGRRLCDEQSFVCSASLGCIKVPSGAGKMEIPASISFAKIIDEANKLDRSELQPSGRTRTQNGLQ